MGNKLTIKEFINLSDDEKKKRYAELSDHDKFLWRTNYEVPAFKATGKKVEYTTKEKIQNRARMEKILRETGVLKEGEHIPEENWLD